MEFNHINANVAYFKKLHKYSDRELATMAGLTEPTFRKRMRTPETFNVLELSRLAAGFHVDVKNLLEKR